MLCIQSPPKRELYNQNPEKVIISKLAALDYMWGKKAKPTSTLHQLFAGFPPPPPKHPEMIRCNHYHCCCCHPHQHYHHDHQQHQLNRHQQHHHHHRILSLCNSKIFVQILYVICSHFIFLNWTS